MMHNVGKIDRIIRLIAAITIALLFFFNVIDGVIGNIAVALAAILVLSATRRCCPLYAVFGFGTCQSKSKKIKPIVEVEELNL